MKSPAALIIAATRPAPAAAQAANLTVVNVSALAVNCVFNTSCTVTDSDNSSSG